MTNEYLSKFDFLPVKLYAHQVRCLDFLKDRKFGALLMDMGTGKSITILSHVLANGLTPCLIVTKNSIKANWRVELEKVGVNADDVVVLDGSTTRKRTLLSQDKRFFILNYESFRLLKDEIAAKKFQTIILDESTAIKNPTAKVSKAILAVSPKIPNRFILTGTPITNDPLDAFNQFAFLDSKILFYYNFYAFKNYYCVMVERCINGRHFKDVVAFKNLDELVGRVQPHSFMIKKEDCLDLPPKVYETRMIEMPDEQRRIYESLADELVAEVSTTERVVVENILVKILRLQQILGGFATTENGAVVRVKENKTDELLDVLDEIGKDKRVVVWARFLAEIHHIENTLKGRGYKVKSIYGDVKTDERQNIVDELNRGDIQIIVAQQQTAGYGLNITGASYAIYFSNDWSLQNRQQSEDRIYRIGQTQKTTIIDIFYKDTIEETIIKALKTKKTFQDIFFADTSNIKNILKGGKK